MNTTKLAVLALIGLAMIEFSIAQPLSAAVTTKAPKAKIASEKSTPTRAVKSSMQGVAAFYADKFEGKKTSSGQIFRQDQMTAAHKTLPLGTKVRVTNLRNNRSVEVCINDRGPWVKNRVIDLSSSAARQVGMLRAGTAMVKLEIIDGSSSGKS